MAFEKNKVIDWFRVHVIRDFILNGALVDQDLYIMNYEADEWDCKFYVNPTTAVTQNTNTSILRRVQRWNTDVTLFADKLAYYYEETKDYDRCIAILRDILHKLK